MATVYIGADVDCKMTELAMEIRPGEVMRRRVPTTVHALRQALAEVGGTKKLTFEEGPMAQRLYRNLKADVDELIVCDPRRNRLISDDGEKADPIDAAKLAELYRGRFLRQVYHSDDDRRVLLKAGVAQGVGQPVPRSRHRRRPTGQQDPGALPDARDSSAARGDA